MNRTLPRSSSTSSGVTLTWFVSAAMCSSPSVAARPRTSERRRQPKEVPGARVTSALDDRGARTRPRQRRRQGRRRWFGGANDERARVERVRDRSRGGAHTGGEVIETPEYLELRESRLLQHRHVLVFECGADDALGPELGVGGTVA